jgi:hypothetical protein
VCGSVALQGAGGDNCGADPLPPLTALAAAQGPGVSDPVRRTRHHEAATLNGQERTGKPGLSQRFFAGARFLRVMLSEMCSLFAF